MSPSFRTFLPSGSDAPSPYVGVRLVAPPPAPAAWLAASDPACFPSTAPPPPPEDEPIAVTLGAARWRDVRMSPVDGHTLRIQRGRRFVRRTYADLGLYDKRTREPTEKWWMLLDTCKDNGVLHWDGFIEFNAAKQAVFVLNRQLKAAFGFYDNPFYKGSARSGWRTKFIASPDAVEEV
jgi:hypothetical protein